MQGPKKKKKKKSGQNLNGLTSPVHPDWSRGEDFGLQMTTYFLVPYLGATSAATLVGCC